MINLFIIISIALILLISNYTALIYGIRIGKAMQNDIPPVPIEPVKKAVKSVHKLIKDWPAKSYLWKKEPKQEENFWD
jgi:hypothetical protein